MGVDKPLRCVLIRAHGGKHQDGGGAIWDQEGPEMCGATCPDIVAKGPDWVCILDEAHGGHHSIPNGSHWHGREARVSILITPLRGHRRYSCTDCDWEVLAPYGTPLRDADTDGHQGHCQGRGPEEPSASSRKITVPSASTAYMVGPATLADGSPGIRLYCPRCDADLGTWPCLGLRDAQYETEQHYVHGLELLREASEQVKIQALAEYYERHPATAENCCVCESPHVVYHNYKEQPFCAPCANGGGAT